MISDDNELRSDAGTPKKTKVTWAGWPTLGYHQSHKRQLAPPDDSEPGWTREKLMRP